MWEISEPFEWIFTFCAIRENNSAESRPDQPQQPDGNFFIFGQAVYIYIQNTNDNPSMKLGKAGIMFKYNVIFFSVL